ncbi:enoyl-CoA hydratase/isomerase family protein [Kribbella sp. NBC_01505]|uniref:enoyl-CoA hydratase/isomerase family protein n=1 Tax=Kribbella sp. NBC_01505 TaxID=2903580 RepID=UPI0038657C9E
MQSADSGIRLTIQAGTAEITIDRPAVGNTLDSRALAGLTTALQTAERDGAVHSAVLRSGVEAVFCSGGSYADPEQPGRASPDYAPHLADCFEAWTARSFPVIAVVDGAARAFGAALALTSDLIVATPRASFGLPELSRGVVPSYAIALLRTRHSSQFVRELVFSTEPVPWRDVTTDPDNVVRTHLERFAAIGPDAVRAAHRTLTAIDGALDLDAVHRIAADGVAEQLRRYDEGRADQSYLGL